MLPNKHCPFPGRDAAVLWDAFLEVLAADSPLGRGAARK